MHAQRLRNAGAEALGLNDHRDEAVHFFHAGAQRQVAQGTLARRTGAQLQVHQAHLVAQHLALVNHVVGHAIERRLGAQPGLHAHRHEVECIGKRLEDFSLAQEHHARQHHIGQVVADRRSQQQPHQQVGALDRRAQQGEAGKGDHRQADREDRLHAEKGRRRRSIADARIDETPPQRRRLEAFSRRRQLGQRPRRTRQPVDPAFSG